MGIEPPELPNWTALDSLGWVKTPSPLADMPALAKLAGLEGLLVKRDDRLDALSGGAKARKLDMVLAAPRFASAKRWVSGGSVGSSHLAACALAARARGVALEAHVFLQPLSAGMLENLAVMAGASTRFVVYGSRVELARRRPELLFGDELDGAPIIPFGATSGLGVVAMARAGLELAAQLRDEGLAPPEVVYCAFGTGGVAAGLALGLGLAGCDCEVRAVRVVEWPLASRYRLRRLIAGAVRELAPTGLKLDAAQSPVRLRVVGGQVGSAYGHVTPASLAATEILRREGVPAEPIYTGKAFAALLDDARRGERARRVLFWQTTHAAEVPIDPAWQEHLPAPLTRWLSGVATPSRTRRRVFLGAAATAVAAVAVARAGFYSPLPGWRGLVLDLMEAHVLVAAAAVLVGGLGSPPALHAPPNLAGISDVDGLAVAANVDRFVATLPASQQRDVHQLFLLIEHGTTPLGSWWSRFTELAPEARDAYLVMLRARGGLLGQAYRGLRDLVLLGYYQTQESWRAMDYLGPLVAATLPLFQGDDLSAPRGSRPRSEVRSP